MTLKDFSLIKNLTAAELQTLEKELIQKTFAKNEVFIEQDGNDDCVYFITSGFVKIYRINEVGQTINLAILGPGETIGEMSPIFGNPRSAFCETQSEVSVFVLSGEKFRNILKTSPDIMFAVLKNFCERLSSANKHLEEIMSLKLKDRTMSLLNVLVKHFPDKNIPVTQEELASILSATRPRVSEVLQELQSENKIQTSHKSIKIL